MEIINKNMTAEEILKKNQEQAYYNQNSDYRIKSMQEYAKLKCQKLLLLVAEKAKIKENRSRSNGYDYTERYVDKDSILNAVDLEKFCS